MTQPTEQRLHEAAAAARHAARRVDQHRMYAAIVRGRDRQPGWRFAGALAGVAAALAVGVAALSAGPDRPVVEGDVASSPSSPPSTEPVSVGPGPGCSATGLPKAASAQPQVPDAVAALRDRIAQLAVSCDVGGLAAMTDDRFSFTFGAADDPAEHWQRLEQGVAPDDHGPLEAMRLVLDTPPGTMETASGGPAVFWTWPRLALLTTDAPSSELDAAMDEVVATGLHTREELEAMFARGDDGYLGYRLMIELREDTPGARWAVFMAGD